MADVFDLYLRGDAKGVVDAFGAAERAAGLYTTSLRGVAAAYTTTTTAGASFNQTTNQTTRQTLPAFDRGVNRSNQGLFIWAAAANDAQQITQGWGAAVRALSNQFPQLIGTLGGTGAAAGRFAAAAGWVGLALSVASTAFVIFSERNRQAKKALDETGESAESAWRSIVKLSGAQAGAKQFELLGPEADLEKRLRNIREVRAEIERTGGEMLYEPGSATSERYKNVLELERGLVKELTANQAQQAFLERSTRDNLFARKGRLEAEAEFLTARLGVLTASQRARLDVVNREVQAIEDRIDKSNPYDDRTRTRRPPRDRVDTQLDRAIQALGREKEAQQELATVGAARIVQIEGEADALRRRNAELLDFERGRQYFGQSSEAWTALLNNRPGLLGRRSRLGPDPTDIPGMLPGIDVVAPALPETLEEWRGGPTPRVATERFDKQVREVFAFLASSGVDRANSKLSDLDRLMGRSGESALNRAAASLARDPAHRKYGDEVFTDKEVERLDRYDAAAQRLSATLRDQLAGSVEGVASAFGRLAAGEDVFKNFGSTALASIGGFATDLGKAMIAIGVAGVNIKKFITNPWGAIAAGFGLVALGAYLTSRAQQSVNRLSDEPTSFYNGNYRANTPGAQGGGDLGFRSPSAPFGASEPAAGAVRTQERLVETLDALRRDGVGGEFTLRDGALRAQARRAGYERRLMTTDR